MVVVVKGDLRAEHEEYQEADYDDGEDDPARPAVPCGGLAAAPTEGIVVAPSSHCVRM